MKASLVFSLSLLAVTALGQPLPPQNSTITLKSVATGKYVTVDTSNSDQLGANALADITAEQRFFVDPVDSNRFRLKSAATGLYVFVADESNAYQLFAGSKAPSPGRGIFEWVRINDNTVSIRDYHESSPKMLIEATTGSGTLKGNGNSIGPETHFQWRTVPPNIVLIYIDDWAWNASPIRMDPNMNNSSMEEGHIGDIDMMPNLKDMARNGVVFRNTYGSPQCSPARAAILTGQSNARNQLTVEYSLEGYYDSSSTRKSGRHFDFPVIANGSRTMLDANTQTLPQALARLGYKTGFFGKWHLGGNGPSEIGFDESPGGTTDNMQGQTINGNDRSLDNIVDPKRMGEITDQGINFMERKVSSGEHFYVQLSHYAFHESRESTIAARALFQNHPAVAAYNLAKFQTNDPAHISRKHDPAVWLGMAYNLDQTIGQVRQSLQHLKIVDNTYVVVTSDNGYRHEFFDELTGLAQPLHAAKWWAWEAGIRVPMIALGPRVSEHSISHANVVNYDLLPTFFELGGGDPRHLADTDGMSLVSVMEGKPTSTAFTERKVFFHYPHYRATMPHSAMIKGDYKVVYFYETPIRWPGRSPVMLFNLANDLGEFNNLYNQDDPTDPMTILGESMKRDLTSHLSAVGARIPANNNNTQNTDFSPATPTGFNNYNAHSYLADKDPNDIALTSITEDQRYLWGPFVGTRKADADEVGGSDINGAAGLYKAKLYSDAYGISHEIKKSIIPIEDSSWLEYQGVELPPNNSYTFKLRVASEKSADSKVGTILVTYEGVSIGEIDVYGTDGNQNWKTVATTVKVPDSSSGTKRLLRFDILTHSASFRLRWFQFN